MWRYTYILTNVIICHYTYIYIYVHEHIYTRGRIYTDIPCTYIGRVHIHTGMDTYFVYIRVDVYILTYIHTVYVYIIYIR
jgi:hypothetical protein